MNTKVDMGKLEWYADTEYAYTDLGIDYATVYRAGIETQNKYYEITIYPIKLINKDADGWDYRITIMKVGEMINEYDAGAEHEDHFKSKNIAKTASIRTLSEMLSGEF